jgi:hypothetical protein
MDNAYVMWLGVIALGIVVGMFVNPRPVLLITGVLFAVSVAGLAVSVALSQSTLTWFFALASMAIPVLGCVAAGGAAVAAVVRGAVSRRPRE